MNKFPKRQPGSTVWYRAHDGGYECQRSADATPPEGLGWVRGFAPRDPIKQAAISAARSEQFKGRVMTPEWRAKMSAASKGRPKSEAHKAAMSIAQKNRNRKPGV